ncbi:MAG: hypothetical protein E7349_02905 [Clostridiales bacterium]|nr:hypothetical protein [Clostridiales bacterium]
MVFGFDTCYSVVDCRKEYRINFFNKRYYNNTPEIKVNRSVKMIDADEDGNVVFNSESQRIALRRAKRNVVDLSLCNDFDYFGTITLGDEKVGDLINYPQRMKDKITKAFNHYKERRASEFQYILVPEYGSKTHRLHFHFIVRCLNKDDLFINKNGKLDWRLSSDRFGFTQITEIKNTKSDRVRVAKYCAKYVSKDSLKICNHRYFASKDLKRPQRSVFDDDDEAMLVCEWLEAQGISSYCDMEYAKCFSIPAHVFCDLMEYLERVRRSKLPYLIPMPDNIISPWDWNFKLTQISYKELLA